MISTGNDIVVLAATDQERTCRVRFYSRIISPAEVALFDDQPAEIAHAPADAPMPFSTFVWLMWSIKESAYKFVSRSNPSLIFAPLKTPVSRVKYCGDYYEGTVQYEGRLMYSRSFLSDGTIMTVVSDERNFLHTRWGLHHIDDPRPASQSAKVRAFALAALAADISRADLRIVRSPDGAPEIWDGETPMDIPVSLAHHDNYIAWSYCLTANNSSYKNAAAN